MNCPVCNIVLPDAKPVWFGGLRHTCDTCRIRYKIANDTIEEWGIDCGDLALFGERHNDVVKIWRVGSGTNAYLYKEPFRLPDKPLLKLFLEYIGNKVN
jgi:hypothetical protein